jgi:hypothetical protein
LTPARLEFGVLAAGVGRADPHAVVAAAAGAASAQTSTREGARFILVGL